MTLDRDPPARLAAPAHLLLMATRAAYAADTAANPSAVRSSAASHVDCSGAPRYRAPFADGWRASRSLRWLPIPSGRAGNCLRPRRAGNRARSQRPATQAQSQSQSQSRQRLPVVPAKPLLTLPRRLRVLPLPAVRGIRLHCAFQEPRVTRLSRHRRSRSPALELREHLCHRLHHCPCAGWSSWQSTTTRAQAASACELHRVTAACRAARKVRCSGAAPRQS